MIKPDKETIDRIKNLGVVGTALHEIANDNNHMTNIYLAKQSLLNFSKGISKLELDEESKKGMEDLIKYLQIKIDRRMKYASE